MGQLVFIDEDELRELKIKSAIADKYRESFEKTLPIFLQEINGYETKPVSNWQYDCAILEALANKILDKQIRKKKWWNV